MAADDKNLEGFQKMLSSAQKNADMGELNIEMAKAQTTQLMETLKAVDENMLREKELIKNEKDAVKVNQFMK